jgi:hypothetical protein
MLQRQQPALTRRRKPGSCERHAPQNYDFIETPQRGNNKKGVDKLPSECLPRPAGSATGSSFEYRRCIDFSIQGWQRALR